MILSQRKINLLVSIITLCVLFPVLFVSVRYARLAASLLLLIAAVAATLLIRKKSIYSINSRQVLLLTVASAALFQMLCYIAGLYFGYYANPDASSPSSILLYALPSALIIVSCEVLRGVLLGQEQRSLTVLSYVICLIGELFLCGGLSLLNDRFQFMEIVAQTLLPALLSNLVYHYMTKRYGIYPNVAFRLVLSVLPYFIPFTPAVPEVLNALLLILLPVGFWFFIHSLFEKKQRTATKKTGGWVYAGGALLLSFVLAVTLLVTGQFHFGVLVIATESMQGTVDVGDVILYEEYDGESVIKKNDIVIFSKNGATLIVHRVTDIENINGQVRYYTKGDANPDEDLGYITAEDITGVVLQKIPYLGSATLWFRSLFQ